MEDLNIVRSTNVPGVEMGVMCNHQNDWFAANPWRAAGTHLGLGLLTVGVTVGAAYEYYRRYTVISNTEQQYMDGCDARFAAAPIEAYQGIIDDCKTGAGYENLGYAAKQGLDYMLQGVQLAYNAWAHKNASNINF